MPVISLLTDQVRSLLINLVITGNFLLFNSIGCLCRRNKLYGFIWMQNSGSYEGVRLASGQDILSHKLVLDPSFTVPGSLASSHQQLQESFQAFSLSDNKGKVARGICITRSSLKPDLSNFLVIFPPRCKIDSWYFCPCYAEDFKWNRKAVCLTFSSFLLPLQLCFPSRLHQSEFSSLVAI